MLSNKIISDRRTILPLLWIFYVLNILYADVLNNMGALATIGSSPITNELIETLLTPEMLLIAAFILEAAMIMIILSRVLPYKINRVLNITVALLETLTVIASLFVGESTIYYRFFATVETMTSIFIIWYAWRWTESKEIKTSDIGNI
ncbi:MAG: DUF6326 family protein [Colwellia sp.]|nr:DUF6326 family protein [Colwellia sp.]